MRHADLCESMDVNLVHLHLLLNHVPTVGTVVALAFQLLAFAKRSEDLMRASLAVFFGIALVSLPAYMTGYAAQNADQGASRDIGRLDRRAPERRAARADRDGGHRRRGVVRTVAGAEAVGPRALERGRRPAPGGRHRRAHGERGEPGRPDHPPGDRLGPAGAPDRGFTGAGGVQDSLHRHASSSTPRGRGLRSKCCTSSASAC